MMSRFIVFSILVKRLGVEPLVMPTAIERYVVRIGRGRSVDRPDTPSSN
jgi:hypothetical protein